MKNPAKIGIVLKGYPRLSETFISQEILSLQKRGYDFHIISLRHPTDKHVHPVNNEITAPVTYLPEYVRNDPMRVLKAWWQVRRKAGYKKARSEFFRDLFRDLTPNRGRRFAQAMVLAAEFSAEIDCLYAHFLHTPTSVARYAAMIMEKPFAISAHAKDIWTSPDWEIREKLDDCEWLATCTKGGAQHLQGLAAQPDKVRLVYHGLDLKRFPPSKRVENSNDGATENRAVQLLSVGRAVNKKGLDTLLDALAGLPKNLHWRWTHIGGGPLRDSLIAQADRLSIGNRCEFLGALAQEEVIAAYQKSDIFVLPCRIDDNGDRDGLPNVIVEAQSQGLPVISTPISGIPELLVEGENGAFSNPNDAPELAARIEELIGDPKLRDKMGANGESKVRSKLDHDATIGQLAQLIDNLIESSSYASR